MIMYNDDYKDQLPKKRNNISNKSRGNRRSRRVLKNEGKVSNRRPQKSNNALKGSHKRSQSFNKSNTDRYQSVQHNGYHQVNEDKQKTKKNFTKTKFNTIVNNRTPQIYHKKGKFKETKLDLSLRNAKRNLHNYFRESKQFENYNQNYLISLTGREKGKVL